MTDENKPGTEPAGIGDDETTRTPVAPVTPVSPAAPAPAVPPMTPAWDPVRSDPTAAPAWTPVAPSAPLTPAGRTSSADPVYENDVAWAVSAPVVPAGSSTGRRRAGRVRWAAALAIVVLIMGTSAAVAAIITGRSAGSTVIGYAPADTTLYMEVRLDLPGDQRQAVGAFLQKFPGFKDQAALDTKLDEVLDDLVRDATGKQQTYTGDIKPWFDGELGYSMGPLPTATALKDPKAAMGALRALVVVSITDPTAAQAWIDAELTKTGAASTTEAYQGATIHLFDPSDGLQPAYAIVDGKVIAIGDVASVKAAIDTKGSGGFADEPGPKAALGSVSGDHVGFVYTALRPLLAWSTELSQSMGAELGAPSAAITASMLKAIPEWAAYWLKFQDDAIVIETTIPKPDTAAGPTENRSSKIAEHIPSTAVVAATTNDLGKNLKKALDLYRSEPSFKSVLDQLDQGLSLVGGEDAALGWAGDGAVVVDLVNGAPEGGLIVTPTDPEAAQKLFTALRAFIAIGGGQQGITVTDEDYNGTKITTVDLGDIGKLAGAAGGDSQVIPLPTGSVQIAYAVTDQVVVIGSGSGFVKHVLDTTAGTSLAANDDYKKLLDRVGANTGTVFVDISTIRETVEKWFASSSDTAAALDRYTTDVKPFLDPFDALIAAGSVSGDLTQSVVVITVH